MKETDTWPLCNPRLYFLHCLCSSHQGMSRGNSWLCKHDSCDGNPVLHHSTDTLNIVCCNSTSPCYIICPFQTSDIVLFTVCGRCSWWKVVFVLRRSSLHIMTLCNSTSFTLQAEYFEFIFVQCRISYVYQWLAFSKII